MYSKPVVSMDDKEKRQKIKLLILLLRLEHCRRLINNSYILDGQLIYSEIEFILIEEFLNDKGL